MNIRERITKRLDKQEEIEGPSAEIKILRFFLSKVKKTSDWDSLTDASHRHWGEYSYQCHIFYHPTKLLLDLINFGKTHGENEKDKVTNYPHPKGK